MAAPPQLVTLQFGANWAGAHFWNLQDELLGVESGARAGDGGGADPSAAAADAAAFDFSCLFYETADERLPYAPRALVFDDPDALGAGLASVDNGDGDPTADDTWAGDVVVPAPGAAPAPSAFAAALADPAADADRLAAAAAALSSGSAPPASWTDYLKAPLPRSSLVAAAPAGWARRAPGFGPPPDPAARDALAHGLRRHAERCDRLGGLLFLVADDGGWGGAGAAALAACGDDYARVPRLAFCVREQQQAAGGDGASPSEAAARAAAAALTAGLLAPAADVSVVLAPPAPSAARFAGAALAAAAIDGVTTPCRLTGGVDGAVDAAGLAALLACGGGGGAGTPAAVAGALPGDGASLAGVALWTPGCGRVEGGGVSADAVTFRGGAAADASVFPPPPHPRHTCRAAAPLALPLPFPNVALGLRPDAGVATLTTRLFTGPALAATPCAAAAALKRPPPGWRALLTEWGVDDEGAAEAAEAAAGVGERVKFC